MPVLALSLLPACVPPIGSSRPLRFHSNPIDGWADRENWKRHNLSTRPRALLLLLLLSLSTQSLLASAHPLVSVLEPVFVSAIVVARI